MANTNESFIDEVAEALRRDRLNQWFRRWGWVIALVVLAIVGAAGWYEWSRSQAEADAQFRGEALLTALETESAEDRLAALSDLPLAGPEGAPTALLLAAEQQDAGDLDAAVATLNALAADGTVPPLWRDLAAFKALLIQGANADPAALEALAAPGAPFGALASEQLALLDLEAGRTDAAVARLRALYEGAEASQAQRARVEALLVALGQPPQAAASPAEPVAPATE